MDPTTPPTDIVTARLAQLDEEERALVVQLDAIVARLVELIAERDRLRARQAERQT